jgi:hypothetical protein
VRLEGLGNLKKFSDLIGNRTRDLSACSIVPQPTKGGNGTKEKPCVFDEMSDMAI